MSLPVKIKRKNEKSQNHQNLLKLVQFVHHIFHIYLQTIFIHMLILILTKTNLTFLNLWIEPTKRVETLAKIFGTKKSHGYFLTTFYIYNGAVLIHCRRIPMTHTLWVIAMTYSSRKQFKENLYPFTSYAIENRNPTVHRSLLVRRGPSADSWSEI